MVVVGGGGGGGGGVRGGAQKCFLKGGSVENNDFHCQLSIVGPDVIFTVSLSDITANME